MIGKDQFLEAMVEEVQDWEDRLSPEGMDEDALLGWCFTYIQMSAIVEPAGADHLLDSLRQHVVEQKLVNYQPSMDQARLAFHIANAVTLGFRLGKMDG